MAKPLSILFVSSEVYPFSRVGVNSDISYSLPLALRDAGHDIRVMMPKYGTISERKNRIHEINRLRDMKIPMGDDFDLATVKSSSINNSRAKVQAYITTNDKYFNSKKGIYHDPKTFKEYADNPDRFIFFNRTVVETCLLLGWFPDVIHCSDWQAALVPGYVKTLFANKFKKTKVVMSVNDFSFQGDYKGVKYKNTGLPDKAMDSYKHKKIFNFLKGGIIHSDFLTTSSPFYASEILNNSKLSNGLDEFVAAKGDKFKGIHTGTDNWGWNPATDINLEYKLDSDLEEFKYNNRVILVNRYDFEFKPKIPMAGIVLKHDNPNALALLIESADEILKEQVQLIIMSDPVPEYKKELKKIAKKYPDKIALDFSIKDNTIHELIAGIDIYLNFENETPLPLESLYTFNYGGVAITFNNPLAGDFIKAIDKKAETGNSFVFDKYKPSEMLKAYKEAIVTFNNRELWYSLINRGIEENYSWNKSVGEFTEIYKTIIKEG